MRSTAKRSVETNFPATASQISSTEGCINIKHFYSDGIAKPDCLSAFWLWRCIGLPLCIRPFFWKAWSWVMCYTGKKKYLIYQPVSSGRILDKLWWGEKKPMVLPWCWGRVYIVATLYILMQKCSKRCSLTAWKAVIFAWSVDRRISVKGHVRDLSQYKRPMFIASNSFSNPSPNPLYNHLTLPKSLIWLPNIFLFHTKARQQVSHQALLLKGWLRFLGEESVLPLRWPRRQN